MTVAGLVYQIDLSDPKVLQDLDFRERNGYTRTTRPVYCPSDISKCTGVAIVYFSKDETAYAGPLET